MSNIAFKFISLFYSMVLEGNIANEGNMAKLPLRNGVICVTQMVFVARREDWAAYVTTHYI